MPVITLFLITLGSYLIGAIPFGYLIVRWCKGIDIRRHGSGNIGATNVARLMGWPGFVAVFLLDFAKGGGPVLAARSAAQHWDFGQDQSLAAVLAGVGALIGHMWPIYLHFRGGKGVATGAGVISVLAPWPAVFAVATWLIVMAGTRYVSLSSITAGIALALARIAEVWRWPSGDDGEQVLTLFCLAAPLLVILRHRANIGRLWRGIEPRMGRTS